MPPSRSTGRWTSHVRLKRLWRTCSCLMRGRQFTTSVTSVNLDRYNNILIAMQPRRHVGSVGEDTLLAATTALHTVQSVRRAVDPTTGWQCVRPMMREVREVNHAPDRHVDIVPRLGERRAAKRTSVDRVVRTMCIVTSAEDSSEPAGNE